MIKVEKPRGAGKTTELIKLAHENNYALVEPTAQQAMYALRLAKEMGFGDLKILTLSQWLFSAATGKTKQQVLIDELDSALSVLDVAGYSQTVEDDIFAW